MLTNPDDAPQTKVERWHRGEPRLEEYVGSGKLKGKKAIITGGDSGIGRTVAAFFAREGCDVTIGYLKEEEKECVAPFLRGVRSFLPQWTIVVPSTLLAQTSLLTRMNGPQRPGDQEARRGRGPEVPPRPGRPRLPGDARPARRRSPQGVPVPRHPCQQVSLCACGCRLSGRD